MRRPYVFSTNWGRSAMVFAVIAVLLACALHAAELRTWTDSTGKFSVEAELVEVKEGQAVLKRSDGKTVSVAVSRLSAADQQYVQAQAKQQAELQPAAKTDAVAAPSARSVPSRHLELAWAIEGPYNSVAVSPSGEEIYSRFLNKDHDRCDVINPTGNIVRSFPFDDPVVARNGTRLLATPESKLLVFDKWGRQLWAVDLQGKTAWGNQFPQGINDVAVADLDRDGDSEIIVTCNGRGGVHVFDHEGKLIWTDTSVPNIWSVTTNAVAESKEPDIYVVNGARLNIVVFSAKGERLNTIDIRHAFRIQFVGTRAPEAESFLLVGSSAQSELNEAKNEVVTTEGSQLRAVSPDGKEILWTVTFPFGEFFESLRVDPTGKWAAAMTRNVFVGQIRESEIYVVDLQQGLIVDSLHDKRLEQAVWVPNQDSPLLVVATGDNEATTEYKKGGTSQLLQMKELRAYKLVE